MGTSILTREARMTDVKKFASNILTHPIPNGTPPPNRRVEIYVRVDGAGDEDIRVNIGRRKRSVLGKIVEWLKAIRKGISS
jgi:hypothetical protein